jgi:hypothetical protein
MDVQQIRQNDIAVDNIVVSGLVKLHCGRA